jgi:hypothetical protein
MYICSATNITAANAIANVALANWGTSFISAGASARTNKRRPFNVSGGNAEGRLESIATHDDARALLNRKSGELFRARQFTPAGFFFTACKGWARTLQVTFWWSTLWQVESRHRSQPGGGFFTKMLL